ncbi:MAG: hypothetical protein AB7F31_05855 [Parachlamydiales bacterium]
MNVSLFRSASILGAVGGISYLTLNSQASKAEKVGAGLLTGVCLVGAILPFFRARPLAAAPSIDNLGTVWQDGDLLIEGMEGNTLLLSQLRVIVACEAGPNGGFVCVRRMVRQQVCLVAEGPLNPTFQVGDLLRPMKGEGSFKHLRSGFTFATSPSL